MVGAGWNDDRPLEDWEYPDEGSSDEEDESALVPCPQCGADIYEDAVQCPVCGEYVTHGTRAWEGRPGWWIALGLLGIIAVLFVLLRLG
jgi:endogenous inhibitor of DNA gyrase (YacG/DUF329 family)